MLGNVFNTYYEGDNFYDYLHPCAPMLFWKGLSLKGKNLLPFWEQILPFTVDLFSEGAKNYFDRVADPDWVSIHIGVISLIQRIDPTTTQLEV